MEGTILEICVDSVESAVNAARGGADRLELCSGLVVGGHTPTAALLEAVRGETGLPVNVLIRPRFGDFCCTPAERALMCREIEDLVGRGAAGVVIGALRPDGTLDRGAMVDMISAAAGANMTLHRAMDVCRDPLETLEEALDLPGTKVLMKSGRALPQVLEALESRVLLESSAMVQNCGLPGEQAAESLKDAPQSGSYFTTLLVP